MVKDTKFLLGVIAAIATLGVALGYSSPSDRIAKLDRKMESQDGHLLEHDKEFARINQKLDDLGSYLGMPRRRR